jgi:hypothetical protein
MTPNIYISYCKGSVEVFAFFYKQAFKHAKLL